MKKYFCFLVAFIFSSTSFAQTRPDWVNEMYKNPINYFKLTSKFEDFWKDKMADEKDKDDEKVRNGFAMFEEEEEFNIKPQYGWLLGYVRYYRELIQYHPQPSVKYIYDRKKTVNTRATGQWKLAGPKQEPQYMGAQGVPYGIGRVNQVAFSGSHANVMYAIAPAGLFISLDTGNTWQSTGTDYYGFAQFRCIAVDPTNDSIIYLGMGDFTSWTITESGILKSSDFGQTFTPLFNGMDSTFITSIVIDPANTNHIVAGGLKGIYTSFDSGNSWQKTFNIGSLSNKVYDIKFKPGSSTKLYATMNSEFLMSDDGGLTWNLGFNNFQFTDVNMPQLVLGVTAAQPNYVYIFSTQDFGNVYKSTDSGQNFTATKHYTAPSLIGYDTYLGSYGQGEYDLGFYCDPLDSIKLYALSISCYSSDDGGATWNTPYTNWGSYWYNYKLHPDQHQMIRNSLLPDRLWVCNDGGVYMKMNNDSVYIPKQKGLAVTQAYHFDADNIYDSTYTLGTQDNGAYFTNNGINYYSFLGGDCYSKIYSAYHTSAAILASGTNIDMHTGSGGYPFNVPEGDDYLSMSFTPATPITGFLAKTHIWETNNLNGNPAQWRKILNNSSVNDNFVTANHCLADSNIFYAIRSDGYLFRSYNATVTSPAFDSIPLPMGPIYNASMTTLPLNSDTIYLCDYEHLYLSPDRGNTWTILDTAQNLYSGYYEIMADPFAVDGSIYLAAGNKVLYHNDSIQGFEDFTNNLPNVTTINDITVKKFSNGKRKVMANLLCRGIWEYSLPSTITGTDIIIPEEESDLKIYPVPTKESITINSEKFIIEKVMIYNLYGQQIGISQPNIAKKNLTISLQPIPTGVYLVEIVTNKGMITKKIIKE